MYLFRQFATVNFVMTDSHVANILLISYLSHTYVKASQPTDSTGNWQWIKLFNFNNFLNMKSVITTYYLPHLCCHFDEMFYQD